jgi:hypothetical protein
MGKSKFVIFSTEIGASIDPQSVTPPPEDMVVFDRDPIATGSYDPFKGNTMRGAVIPTLGGVYIQDFGPNIQDQRISFSDEAAISKTTVDALIALEAVSSGEYYFTDGYDCFKVQFMRPGGFIYQRDLATSYFNVARFDYTVNLVVKEKMVIE